MFCSEEPSPTLDCFSFPRGFWGFFGIPPYPVMGREEPATCRQLDLFCPTPRPGEMCVCLWTTEKTLLAEGLERGGDAKMGN